LPPTHHPRLYLSQEKLVGLETAIESTHALIWTQVVSWADQQMDAPPTQALEGDFRRVGERIPYAAICGLLSDDSRYSGLAVRTMMEITRIENWGNNHDIEAAHLLYGLAVGYDWIYDDLSTSDRELVRLKIIAQATQLKEFCGNTHPPLNNHRIVKLSALGVAALAVFPEEPSRDWIHFVNRELEKALPYYGSDGMSCEGISYWSYGVEYMLKYFVAADALIGTQFLSHPWIQHAADTPLYYSLPRESWTSTNMFLNVSDSPRFCWYGPHYQLHKLASITRRPEVQWLATEIQKSGYTRHHADWLALLWFDPNTPSHPPTNLPLTKRFADWDLAIMRSSWDADATMTTFKCSPIGGHQLKDIWRATYPGSGHAHPDANSFTLFAAGQWLIADAGATMTKYSRNHNTLLVNQGGQLGEGQRWLDGNVQLRDDCKPGIVFTESGAEYDYFVGDASDLYAASAGLKRFLRHFVYVRPNTVIILDELEAKAPVTFDWLFHSPGSIVSNSNACAEIHDADTRMRMAWTGPIQTTPTIGVVPVEAEYPDKDWSRLNVLNLNQTGTADTWLATAMVAENGKTHDITFVQPSPGRLEVSVQSETRSIRVSFCNIGAKRKGPSVLNQVRVESGSAPDRSGPPR
jgi:hypothetical protein